MTRAPIVPGHSVLYLPVTASTNRAAREGVEAGRLGPGAVVVADQQTEGRGRRGTRWVTLPGRSLAASLVLEPPPLPRPARLAVLAAVACARALERVGVGGVALKWPNDLMRHDRKVGGLLLETARTPSGGVLAVLGMGINLELRPGDLPEGTAGDVGLAGGVADRDRLLAALAVEVDAALAQVGTAADAARGQEYRRRSWLTGRRARVRAHGHTHAGRVADVTPDGDLLLEDGTRLAGEHVHVLQVEPGLKRDARPR